jgi:hypothetical protein
MHAREVHHVIRRAKVESGLIRLHHPPLHRIFWRDHVVFARQCLGVRLFWKLFRTNRRPNQQATALCFTTQ